MLDIFSPIKKCPALFITVYESERGHHLQATFSPCEIEDHVLPTETKCFHHYHSVSPLFPIWFHLYFLQGVKALLCTWLKSYLCVLAQSCQTVIPWTVACQAPLSMEFSRQEYWNELSFSTPINLPNLGTEHTSPALAGRFATTVATPILFGASFFLDPLKLQILFGIS